MGDGQTSRRSYVAAALAVPLVLLAGCVAGPRPRTGHADGPAWQEPVLSAEAVAADRQRWTAGTDLPETPTLADYLVLAQLRNPQLHADYYRWHAAAARIPQARSLPDPTLSYTHVVESTRRDLRQSVSLSQMFPWYDKLRLQGDIAGQQALAQERRFETTRLALLADVTSAYAEYYYLSQALAITREGLRWLESLEEVLQTQYTADRAALTDVVRVQVELGRLEDQVRSLEDLRSPTMARLNALLNRPLLAALPWPEELPAPAPLPSEEDLLARLAEQAPELEAMEHEIEAARLGVRLAEEAPIPDLMLGVEAMDMTRMGEMDDDPVAVMASINLPIWWEKYRAMRTEARALHLAAIRQRVGTGNQLAADLAEALYLHRDALRKVDLYGSMLLPKARESLAITDTAFRGGQATFTDVVDAERILLDFELTYQRALADAARQRARVERLIGGNLALPPAVVTNGGETPSDAAESAVEQAEGQ